MKAQIQRTKRRSQYIIDRTRTVRTLETGGNTEELETTTAVEVTQVIAAEVETG